MRILTITHNYPRFAGDPAGAFVARIAESVAQRGHQVRVVAPHAPGAPEDQEIAGMRIHRFRYAPERFERVAYTGTLHQSGLRSPVAALGFPGFLLAFRRAVRDAVQEFAPDVIHAHWWFPAGWLASGRQIPYVITCHGSDVRLLAQSRFLRRWATPVFRRAAQVTAVSQFLANDLASLFSGTIGPVAVTPMPLDVLRFSAGLDTLKAEPPRILYAGNLVPFKGVDLLIRAAAELSRRGATFQLKILGQGPAEGSLRALADELKVAARVTWSPFVPQSQMPLEYGASTVTVLPTRGQSEGLGLTLVEALLAGSAVVGTPAGGIPEVVRHEETGLLSRPGDPDDMADQLQRLLTDRDLRARLSGAGKAYAERVYSPLATVGRFLEIYRGIADD